VTLLVLVPAFALGVVLCAFISWPLAYRAGVRSVGRDASEIARILHGVQKPTAPVARKAIDWARPTASHASVRVATTSASYQPRHATRHTALVLAHVRADAYIGRPPRELVGAS
jgi:hypothetical protein